MRIYDEAAGVLTDAANIIRVGGWCQDDFADRYGRHCTLGAIQAAALAHGARFIVGPVAAGAVLEEIGHPGEAHSVVALWNDQPERTADDVLTVLAAAALRVTAGNIGDDQHEIETEPLEAPIEAPVPQPAPPVPAPA